MLPLIGSRKRKGRKKMLAVLQNLAMSLKQKINGFGSFYMKNFCPKLVEVLRKG